MSDWAEFEKLSFFITSLKLGPMAEVRKARPTTIEEAITIVDALDDHQFGHKETNNNNVEE